MWQREIALRAHLDQARGGALEFGRLEAVADLVERVGLGRGRGHELHRMIVQRVDQDDETLGGIALFESHDWNAVDDQGVEFVRDAEIIRRRQWLLAEIMEKESCHTHGRARHPEPAALHG